MLDLPDGDFIDIDWLHAEPMRRIAVLVHGLGGSSRSPYVRGLATRLAAAGSSVVAINLRGASGRPNRRARTYHSGDTDDLGFLLHELAKRHPNISLFCAGFSLGGNLLLKWLGENPTNNVLCAAVAVSVPLVLKQSAVRMNSGFSRCYQRHLLNGLKASVRNRLQLLCGRGNIQAALHARNFTDFDEHLTAPVNGFRGASDYYDRCSSRPFLKQIATPTLIIQSVDDPFMTPETIPGEAELSDMVNLELYPRGGHVGFVSGSVPGLADYWLDRRIPAFFEARD